MRSGTENVPGIVGFGTAAKIAWEKMGENRKRKRELRDYFVDRLEREIPDCRLNGSRTNRLPGNVNISFRGIEGESALIRLDMQGICASAGSACTSGSLEPSHVLLAMGMEPDMARASIRMTFSEENNNAEADFVVECLKKIVDSLRKTLDLG